MQLLNSGCDIPVVVRRQAPMAQTVLGSPAAVHRRDHQDPRPDTETGADHPEDPEDCRDTTGAADGHARCNTRQSLGIQKCIRQWELPQVQHNDEIVDVAVVMRHQVPTIQTAQTQRQVPVHVGAGC